MKNITVQCFKLALQHCFGSKGAPTKIAVGLSGGPDSMLLVWLLQKYKAYMPHNDLEIHAITIDHNYRSNSAIEAKRISQWMNQWNVNHIIHKLQYSVDPTTIANFEEVARTKRYEAIRSVCNTLGISTVVLGHHCDDQVETFVQRLQGNSSIFGLACTRRFSNIPLSRDLSPSEQTNLASVMLVRPLLGFEKKAILSTCQSNNIPYVVDPTNNDTKLTRRNYLRHLFGKALPQMLDSCYSQLNQGDGGVVNHPSVRYKSIAKDELVKSQQECADFAQKFELKAHRLHHQLVQQRWYLEFPAMGLLKLQLPKHCLDGYNKIITSKFLYQKLYPYSTLNHYHWAYAKLERGLLPKLEQVAKCSRSGVTKLSCMNLIFEVTNNAHASQMEIKIFRTPLTRKELKLCFLNVHVNEHWSQWHLFDKRFWLRFSTLHGEATCVVKPYFHKFDFPIVRKYLKENGSIIIDQRLDTLPALFQDGEIVAFPTLNIGIENIQCEWALKANKYDFISQPV